MTEPLIRPEVKRDRYGRYLLPDPRTPDVTGAAPWTRATTFAKSISDSFGLTKWQLRMAVKGLTVRPDLFARAAAAPIDDKATLDKVAEDAKEAAGSSTGANAGTALHQFTERLDAGEKIAVPAPWDADVAAYRKTLDEAGITFAPEYIERIVTVPEFSVAGTFDRIAQRDGQLFIADLKTGKDLSYGWLEIAIQLALYANATGIWDAVNGRYEPMPEVSKTTGLVFHLPVGKAECTVYEVDLAAGWEAVQLCADVRRWRSKKGLAKPLGAAAATPKSRAPWRASCDLAAQIDAATSVADLEALWARNEATWQPRHTKLAKARKAQLTS